MTEEIKRKTISIEKIRTAVADYMQSEGCGCCSDYDKHREDYNRLGELLNVPMYDDKSGYDFSIFETGAEDESRD